MTQKIKIILVSLCFLITAAFALSPVASAASCTSSSTSDPNCTCSYQGTTFVCTPKTSSSGSSSSDIGNGCPKGTTANACLTQDPIVKDLNIIVNVLSGLVGVVVTAVIVLGGVQYATAGGSSEAVTKAKARITNGLLALLAFILTYAFLQWIIPGGVFS